MRFPELQAALTELRKTTSDKTAQLKALVSAHFDQYLSCHEAVRVLAADINTHQQETEALVSDMQNLSRVTDASLAVMLQRARDQRRIRHTLAVLARLRPILELTSKMKASLRIQDYDKLAVDFARLKHQSGKIANLAAPLKRVVAAGHEIAATANAELLRKLEDMSASVADQKRAIDVLTALALVEKPILTCLAKQFEYLETKLIEIAGEGTSQMSSEAIMKECVAIAARFRSGLWGFICELFKTPAGSAAATSNAITSVEAERVQQQAWSILSKCSGLLERHASPPSALRLQLLTEAFRQFRCLRKCPNAAALNANIEKLNETFCDKFRTDITLGYLEQVCQSAKLGLLADYFEPVVTVLPSFSSDIALATSNATTLTPAMMSTDSRTKVQRVILEARKAFDIIKNTSTISSESKILLHRPSVFIACATDILQRWRGIWKDVGQALLDVLDISDRTLGGHSSTAIADTDVDFHFRAQIIQALENHLRAMLSEFLDKVVAAFVGEITPPTPVEASTSSAANRGGARLKYGNIDEDAYNSMLEHGRAATSGTRALSNLVQQVEIKCMDIYSSTHAEPLQRILRAGAAEEPFQSQVNNSNSRHNSRSNRSSSVSFQTASNSTSSTATPSDPRQYVFNVLLQMITLRSEVEMSVGDYPQCWDYIRSVTDPLTAELAEFLQSSVRSLEGTSGSSLDEWKRCHLLVESRFFLLALGDLMAESTKTQLEAVEKQLVENRSGEAANAGRCHSWRTLRTCVKVGDCSNAYPTTSTQSSPALTASDWSDQIGFSRELGLRQVIPPDYILYRRLPGRGDIFQPEEASPKPARAQHHLTLDLGGTESSRIKMHAPKTVLLAMALLALVSPSVHARAMDVDEWPSTESDHTKLQIVLPEKLMKKDGYAHKEALFGYPAYSMGSLQTQLVYTSESGCEEIKNSDWEPPFALMLDRGDCHFVEKVRRAQHAGARAVLIADNKCLCTDVECLRETGDDFCETVLPFMADDESGGDISIPSMLIRKSDGDAIKREIAQSKGVSNVMVKFDWGIPSPDGRVEWTLWQSAWDDQSLSTLANLEEMITALSDRAFFTPHFVSYNGTKVGCHDDSEPSSSACGNMCLNNGRYCLLDPSPFHDRTTGASGADVVLENLRRKCIWKLESKTDPGVGLKWWKYVKASGEACGQDENTFRERSCAEKVMKELNIDIKAVEECMQPYGVNVDEVSPLLEEELKEQTALQLLRLPALYVDGVHARGRVDPTSILGMVCAGYGVHDPPAVCSCASQSSVGLLDCVKVGSLANAAAITGNGGYSFMSLVAVLLAFVGIVAVGGFVYWRRTQRHMRDQVRSILAEYMPLEDQTMDDDYDLEDERSRMLHPAERAAAKSPRGYMPSRGFLEEDEEEGM
ncbi:Vacuolar-sorting receptor 1 [Phytophthora citrophthora]|uniref:Vacuolar-sorting receptor 1 n=1 Tax=Phytophthora citrophthora TaxID=4793 RepID=A0AAD9LS76_9STRA|nr:Vacuolar-sorting receptor 1 [Phytophthora citrophthora]